MTWATDGASSAHLEPGATAPEHDETDRDQEEVFFVVRGSPSIVIDGESRRLPAGTFVRLDPQPRRGLVNDGPEPALVLIVSAPTSSGYEPMGWA
ncbi:MAG: cupin domain-containing protein [Actinomycetota bacterium]|nr:cupin domain-containing protein [Actinomycetota bacterium]